MTDTLKPRDGKDAEDAVHWALADGKTLEIVGHGSKRSIGRPAQTDFTLDMSGFSGVTMYEPEELVLTARAGTPLAEIETLIGARNQHLGFEPIDVAALFGETAYRGTIGGVLATDLSGPRRIRAGAARDHFLGFSAVSGRGETFKSGGRVVKNVTGYDLCKLMAGSWGTLGVLTEITMKVLPRPETETTILMHGLDDATAVRAMTAALGTSCEVTGAAHLPAAVTARIALVEAIASGRALTALRLEGIAGSVVYRKGVLRTAVKEFGETGSSAELVSRNLWKAIRDVTPFAAARTGADQPLWRISTAPAKGAELARLIGGDRGAEVLYDWGGGLLWVLLPPSDDAGTALVRRAVKTVGGHATLVRASAGIRAATAVFQTHDDALASLTKRVKDSFDPKAVLNPGRMYAGV
jgi:glycolate dehydrogenase FAD-binding subunit